MAQRRGTPTKVGEITFRSALEGEIALALISKGVEFEYEQLTVLYDVPSSYTVDFTFETRRSNKVIHVEVKGYFPREDRSKMLQVQRCNPDLNVRMLFSDATKRIGGKRSMTYGAWATRYKFIWGEGPEALEDWLNE